jgi:disulfide bond formation protein DsbB
LRSNFGLARWIALLLPLALIAGALGSQYIGGLFPCEMCMWQRWPHYAAIVAAALSFPARRTGTRRGLVSLAGVLILVSGVIGAFHAGVEYHWWEGFTQCSSTIAGGSPDDMLARIMAAPLVRCDVAPWSLLGISLAGWNAIVSIPGAIAIFALSGRRRGA